MPGAGTWQAAVPADRPTYTRRRPLRRKWRQGRLLFRALTARRALRPLADRTGAIAPGAILLFACVRNEALRLPWFLRHYRRLGVDHFLVVDNGSTDGTVELLASQKDVSLWHARGSYRAARFGLDWLTWLMIRHAHGHWCLAADADELLVYPHWETRPLPALTSWLDRQGARAMPAMMLELYPKGPIGAQTYRPGDDPFAVVRWFDPGNYRIARRADTGGIWIQGGPRERAFYAAEPRRAPTLNKVPLVRWRRHYVYANSTHALLPASLNAVADDTGGEAVSGVLLHTKFLPDAGARALEEKSRGEHFADPARHGAYYDALAEGPDLWCPDSRPLRGWRQLEALGLISRGGWV